MSRCAALLPCVCGTKQRPVLWRRGPHSLLSSYRCPMCGRLGYSRRPEELAAGWNESITIELQRRKP
jgi:hypothetical protein